MLIVHVDIRVKPEYAEAFRAASAENARQSIQEPGIEAFDVLQDLSDAAHFVLNEVYRDSNAAVLHKETTHYAVWRDAVAPMMAKPRTSVKFSAV